MILAQNQACWVIEQNKRLKMSIYNFSHLIFGKDSRKIYDVESKSFPTHRDEETGCLHVEERN